MDYAVRAERVYKIFPAERYRATMYRALRRKLARRGPGLRTIAALNDINFEIRKGEKIGVVGNNGAGKTTLLKVIAGLYEANKGRVDTGGSVSYLGGLGVGMEDELSVEENVFLYGTIYGMERGDIRKTFHEIIEWAELQSFTGAKLKTMSSGMKARLAFSVTRHIKSDILLMDEAMSAGDKHFRDKCNNVFEEYRNSGKTFITATHNTAFIRSFCAKTLWLRRGNQIAFGETETVLPEYLESKTG